MSKASQQSSQTHLRPKKVCIIANPASNRSVPLLRTLNNNFRAAGILWDLKVTHEEGDGAIAAREAIEKGFDLVGVFGGDGTLMDACAGLAGSDVPMLILPGGTGNLIAAELGITRDLDRELARVCTGDVYLARAVDVGKMGEQMFLLRVGCGVETNIVQDANQELKKQFGKWAYVFAALKAMTEIQSAEYRITIDDDHVVEGRGVACAVANASSIGVGDLTLSPEIGISDGKLDLVFVRKADVEGLFELARMISGIGPSAGHDLPKEPGLVDASHLVNHWAVRKVKIETDPPLDMQADGNLAGKTPQTIEVLPGALKVVV